MGGNYNRMLVSKFYIPITMGVLAVLLWPIAYLLAVAVHGDNFFAAWLSGVSIGATIGAIAATVVSVISAIINGYDLV